MRNECNVIQDLLPLYCENLVSEDTRAFVDEHLEHCAKCRGELEHMRIPVETVCKVDEVPLKRWKRKMQIKKMQTVLCTMLLLGAFLLAAFSWLTAPKYLPYTADLMKLSEGADGIITVTFGDEVTGYRLYKNTTEKGKVNYNIEAWSATWDRWFQKRGVQNVVIRPEEGTSAIIYYVQNDARNKTKTEDVLLYGTPEPGYGGRITLPGLTLWYHFLLNGVGLIILMILRRGLRKNVMGRKWIERIGLIPVSYMAGYGHVVGFRTVSYSEQRDFSLIMMIGILIYLALWSGMTAYRNKRCVQ